MTISVHYVGPIKDNSGYASAAREYINALIQTKEVDISVEVRSFEQAKTNHGQLAKTIEPFIGPPHSHNKIQIIHTTPENFPTHKKPNKYNIGYTTWETDKLPPKWIDLCNSMNEIWVPSQWNVEVFKKSGVIVPITKIPHVIRLPEITVDPLAIDPQFDKSYIFYSIFQWLERKNSRALLRAYLTEFKANEPVVLLVKSYRINTSPQEKEVVKQEIKRIKDNLRLKTYPPILFFGDLMTAEQMQALHLRGHCFVLPHRAEGFGIPIAEAMAYSKPAITTKYGGSLDFANKENSYLIDSDITPVFGMIFSNYTGDMNWAEPSIRHLKELMRYTYTHQEEAKKKGEVARKNIETKLSPEVIGKLMVDRLKQINISKKR